MKQKPIILKAKVKVTKIPFKQFKNEIIKIFIGIVDNYVIIKASNEKFMRDLVKAEKLKPLFPEYKAKYSKKFKKAIFNYPNRSQNEILEAIKADLKEIGG